jgi:hypothetical protein
MYKFIFSWYVGYRWYWKDFICGNISIYESGAFGVQLRKNNSEFHGAVLQIFNLLLPTQWSELDHILATNPQNYGWKNISNNYVCRCY